MIEWATINDKTINSNDYFPWQNVTYELKDVAYAFEQYPPKQETPEQAQNSTNRLRNYMLEKDFLSLRKTTNLDEFYLPNYT